MPPAASSVAMSSWTRAYWAGLPCGPNWLPLAAECPIRSVRSRSATASTSVPSSPPVTAQEEADYCAGVVATLTWVLGRSPHAPITQETGDGSTSRDLKRERLHAEDVIEQARYPWMSDHLPSLTYDEGVKTTITWLLGNMTKQLLDPPGR